jgi:outer membrane protein assembly factor BamB
MNAETKTRYPDPDAVRLPSVRRLLPHLAFVGLLGAMLLLCATTAPAAATSAGQNWPQWRGPLGTGIAPNAEPPVSWSETENIKWKVKIPGLGTSTPIIWENQVFVLTAIPTGKKIELPAEAATAALPAPTANSDANAGGPSERRKGEPGGGGPGGPGRSGKRGGGGGMRAERPTEVHQFVILCLDRQTGKVLWQQTAREEVPHEAHHRSDGSFASCSPLTDGKHVFAYFGSRGLYCYDMAGQLQWSQDFGDMNIVMAFGEGSSPALYQDILIVNWDHEGESFITALDKNTGKTLWKKARDEKTSWSTPLVVEQDGKPQVIVSATGKIRSYEPATGKVIWECAGLTRNVIPSPVTGNGMVYATSGYQGNALLAIRLDRTGDLTGTDAIAWSVKKGTPYVPSPLLYNDRLYLFAGNNAMLSCFDGKSGRALIDAERIEALSGVYASPVGADGRVYLVGRNGTTVVLKSSDKLEVLATYRLDEKTDASPALAGKDLFLRGREYLYCIAAK